MLANITQIHVGPHKPEVVGEQTRSDCDVRKQESPIEAVTNGITSPIPAANNKQPATKLKGMPRARRS